MCTPLQQFANFLSTELVLFGQLSVCLACSSAYFLLHNSGEGSKLLVEQQNLVSVGISPPTFSGCGMVVVERFHFYHTMDLKQFAVFA